MGKKVCYWTVPTHNPPQWSNGFDHPKVDALTRHNQHSLRYGTKGETKRKKEGKEHSKKKKIV